MAAEKLGGKIFVGTNLIISVIAAHKHLLATLTLINI